MSDHSPGVRDNVHERRFELQDGQDTAYLEYRRRGDVLYLLHTEVPSSLRGRGVGSRLVSGVLDRARAEGAAVVPNCPFVKAFLAKHPEYRPLVHVPRAPI